MNDRDADWRARDRARWMQTNAARWMRPDAHRWIRPDVARFLKPGTNPADVFPALDWKFNPDQPRVPAGHRGGGRWTSGGEFGPGVRASTSSGDEDFDPNADDDTDAADQDAADGDFDSELANEEAEDVGSSDATDFSAQRRGRGLSESDFPGASPQQLSRLDQAMARSANGIARVREYDPEWQPREASLTAPGSVEGAIARAEARAVEAEARFNEVRSGIGGNFSPPLDPLPRGPATSQRPFDGAGWIDAYRSINNAPNLFGEPVWPRNDGTVAVAEIDGRLYVGVNSDASTFTSLDRREAEEQRAALIERYPSQMQTENIGRRPNNALYHAEANILMKAARDNPGTLAGRTVEVFVDRGVCTSCEVVLPKLGLELGDPTVIYTERSSGMRSVMSGGYWRVWKQR